MKIATIGSGVIVDRFIEAMHMVDGVELVAVYSRDEARAKEFAHKHNIDLFYTDLADMLCDETVDTIYIASPNSLHYEQCLQALQAKKHVICEKPFTSTLNELDHLFAVSRQNNCYLFEAITTIHLPNYKIIKESLNKIGDVRIIQANFSQYSSKYQAYKEGKHVNVFDPSFSGGALMDINIYNIHFVVGLFGKPNKYTYYPNIGYTKIDTSGVIVMEYDTFIASLTGAKDSSSDFIASIQGDQGSIRVSGLSSGVCNHVTFAPLRGDRIGAKVTDTSDINLGIEQVMHMSYEVQAFQDIIDNKDTQSYEKLLQHSHDVMEVLYNARIQANIVFDADTKKSY